MIWGQKGKYDFTDNIFLEIVNAIFFYYDTKIKIWPKCLQS